MRELYEADFLKPGSIEAGEYGLTRGTCFVARRLEVVAVAALLLISWCVFGAAFFFFFQCFIFFERTGLSQPRDRLASFTSLIVLTY